MKIIGKWRETGEARRRRGYSARKSHVSPRWIQLKIIILGKTRYNRGQGERGEDDNERYLSDKLYRWRITRRHTHTYTQSTFVNSEKRRNVWTKLYNRWREKERVKEAKGERIRETYARAKETIWNRERMRVCVWERQKLEWKFNRLPECLTHFLFSPAT